jgi:hypothetical protein
MVEYRSKWALTKFQNIAHSRGYLEFARDSRLKMVERCSGATYYDANAKSNLTTAGYCKKKGPGR